MIFIDYETICVNCKARGFNFGYSFKHIEYDGNVVMDMPQQNLNGATVGFTIHDYPVLIRCIENAHQRSKVDDRPIFSMINAKKSQNNTILRFTYLYQPNNDPKLKKVLKDKISDEDKLYYYVDIYIPPAAPYVLLFYSFKPVGHLRLEDFNLYQLYDFDIYGDDAIYSDVGRYDRNAGILYQYDAEIGEDKSIYVGIGTIDATPIDHFEINSAKKIYPEFAITNGDNSESIFDDLRDIDEYGPDDCAMGVQWKSNTVKPGESRIYPLYMAFGIGKEDLYGNANAAKNQLERTFRSIPKLIELDSRNVIDEKLKNLNFSLKQWCKE